MHPIFDRDDIVDQEKKNHLLYDYRKRLKRPFQLETCLSFDST